ncbi:MAG TPA: SpoIIE family protein phosphatase [Bacteroidia bacterium]|nr:SpoIIE family protein phosphatase [Bacteroidia bacterium]
MIKKYSQFCTIVLFVFVFFNHNLFAQINSININAINISSRNGLPTNSINYVFKDSYGFYWIGTQAGLCKYDGYKIITYKNNPNDSSSLPCNNILSINQYKNFLIISCEKGITFFDYIKGKFISEKNIDKALNNSEVYSTFIYQDNLFIVSKIGLYEYSFNNKKIVKYKFTDNKNYVFQNESKVSLISNNFLLFDYALGIRILDTTTKIISIEDYASNSKIKATLHYGNFLYLLSSNYGLIRLDVNTFEKIDEPLLFKDLGKDIENQNSLQLIKNKIYIASKTGIIEFNPLDFTTKIIKINGKEENIKKLFSIDNNLFAVSHENGIFIIPYSIQKFSNPIPDNINNQFSNIYSFIEYMSGKILIGGYEKLILFNLLNNKIIKDFSKFYKNKTVLSIISSPNANEYFIGIYGKGVDLLNITNEKINSIIRGIDVISLYYSNDDTLWIGTIQEGLFKLNIKTQKSIKPQSFNTLSINYIKPTTDGIYIATGEKGLYKLDNKNNIILHLNAENKTLSNNWVYHLTEDSNYIYIASDNGLTLFNKKNQTSQFFFDTDGLLSSTILSVYLDNQNNLWIGTTNGITKMILSRLNDNKSKLFYNYTYLEGLVNYEFNQNAHTVLKNNYFVYGGVSGIDIFNPSKIRQNFSSIPVYISSFKTFGKDYPADSNLTLKKYFVLKYPQNNFQVELSAINPLGAEKILYKYKLEGYDDDFSEPTNIRYISYTGLSGGTYKLIVYATNHDGEWNTDPYYIYIDVIPPFWKTKWFIITSAIMLFGSIFGFNQYRTYQIKKRNKELEEKVQERTKELANKNHEILSSIEYAKRIQQAILPTNSYVNKVLPNGFILYLPKDIVSGDFYWLYEINDSKTNTSSKIIAAVDCTGHGVPGALMSMIGNNLLNQIVIEKNITSPEKILNEMNKGVQTALKQGQSEIQTNDGMDASIVNIFPDGKLLWAGAYRPLVIVKGNGQIEKLDGDKYPIGGVQMDADRNYTLHTIQLEKGDTIYLFSDGYADQFGGEKGKKMMLKRFLQILSEIHLKPVNEQKAFLENFFNQWKGSYDQIDDILVIGISF